MRRNRSCGLLTLALLLVAATGIRADETAAPVSLRVGLATDLDAVELCCDRRIRVDPAGAGLTLATAVRIEPAAALKGTATYRLQVAALKDERQAHGLADYLRRETRQPSDVVFDADRDLYRVRHGRFDRREEADAAKGRLTALGVEGGWVVSEGGMLESPSIRLSQNGHTARVAGRWLVVDAPADVGIPFRRARYRSRLLIYLNDRGHLNVINELGIEDYLRGVVPREMGPELYNEIEALKAQTVAARTFTLRNLGEFSAEGYDICSTPRCQVYGGMDVEHRLSDQAIRATDGQVVLVDDEPGEIFYSATCGGHTEDVETVFPLKHGRHLRGVPCLEHGPVTLAGNPRGGAFPGALTARLLPPSPGQPAQTLSARLEHLALLAGLRVPRDRLASTARGEVRRFLMSVFDLALDPRLLGAPEQLVRLASSPPPGWRESDRRLADYLRSSEVLSPESDPSGELSDGESEMLLLQLAFYLGVVESETAAYLSHDQRLLTLHRHGAIETLPRDSELLVYRSAGDRLVAGDLTLLAGDPLDLYWHGDHLLAVAQPRILPAVSIGKRNAKGRWHFSRTTQQLRASVQARYPGFPFTGFQVLSRGSSGRVGSIRLLGTGGKTLLVEGLAVRWTLDLPDTWFTSERVGDSTVFTGRGWGHGVGLCQAGAYGMAARGHAYTEILHHYYTGIELGRLRPKTASGLTVASPR